MLFAGRKKQGISEDDGFFFGKNRAIQDTAPCEMPANTNDSYAIFPASDLIQHCVPAAIQLYLSNAFR
jgi:hypothetical protein